MNKSDNLSVAGCVLAGGGSRRMGTDKALLELDGKPLIMLALECFEAFPEVFISAADVDIYAFTGFRVIPDELPGAGPLAGMASALKAADADYVCFRPVDAPLAPAGLHPMLANACFGRDAAVPTSSGLPEPLFACFSKTALPVLESLLADGKLKAADAFQLLDTAFVPLDSPEVKIRLGDPSVYLVNANDPDTFSKLGKR